MVGLPVIFLSCLPLFTLDLTASTTPMGKCYSSCLLPELLPKAERKFGKATTFLSQGLDGSLQPDQSILAIAKQVTVRIISDANMGSGVIVARQGQNYQVLTNAHVVADAKAPHYTILTADGQTHQGKWLREAQFPDRDLALLQFRRNRVYQTVAIANSNSLALGDRVYAAGFLNWHWKNPNEVEETRDWGIRAFQFTKGQVAMLPQQSLQDGYQLGYTNEIEQGMSGGPVLDRYGRLIGINGRLKYPLQGITSFVFADGTLPSEELFQQMQALSWAIPTAKFQQALR